MSPTFSSWLPSEQNVATLRKKGTGIRRRASHILLSPLTFEVTNCDLKVFDDRGVQTKALNRAVGRNLARFPADFMFQLTAEEGRDLRYQIGTSNPGGRRGGRRYRPYAFTEQGVAMLSSVLRSPRAIAVNVEIMRAFVRLRELISSHADLAAKIAKLEKRYDRRFRVVFAAIRHLMEVGESEAAPKPIGFGRS